MCTTLGVTREALTKEVTMAIFTMSGDGSTLYMDGTEHFIPAVPVTLCDPTGAGDSYRSGFLSAYVRGYTPLTCCRVGTVTASYVVEHAGCQTHLPTWAQMLERYRAHFGTIEALRRGGNIVSRVAPVLGAGSWRCREAMIGQDVRTWNRAGADRSELILGGFA